VEHETRGGKHKSLVKETERKKLAEEVHSETRELEGKQSGGKGGGWKEQIEGWENEESWAGKKAGWKGRKKRKADLVG